MVKVYIDSGHGGNDPGAVANGLREKDLNLKIAKYMRDYLLNNYAGVSVRMSRETDKTVSLSARTNDANKWGADVRIIGKRIGQEKTFWTDMDKEGVTTN